MKLSDYGISAFATPQGVVGEGGTPGFQAPEVKVGSPYDEKVFYGLILKIVPKDTGEEVRNHFI